MPNVIFGPSQELPRHISHLWERTPQTYSTLFEKKGRGACRGAVFFLGLVRWSSFPSYARVHVEPTPSSTPYPSRHRPHGDGERPRPTPGKTRRNRGRKQPTISHGRARTARPCPPDSTHPQPAISNLGYLWGGRILGFSQGIRRQQVH